MVILVRAFNSDPGLAGGVYLGMNFLFVFATDTPVDRNHRVWSSRWGFRRRVNDERVFCDGYTG